MLGRRKGGPRVDGRGDHRAGRRDQANQRIRPSPTRGRLRVRDWGRGFGRRGAGAEWSGRRSPHGHAHPGPCKAPPPQPSVQKSQGERAWVQKGDVTETKIHGIMWDNVLRNTRSLSYDELALSFSQVSYQKKSKQKNTVQYCPKYYILHSFSEYYCSLAPHCGSISGTKHQ